MAGGAAGGAQSVVTAGGGWGEHGPAFGAGAPAGRVIASRLVEMRWGELGGLWRGFVGGWLVAQVTHHDMPADEGGGFRVCVRGWPVPGGPWPTLEAAQHVAEAHHDAASG